MRPNPIFLKLKAAFPQHSILLIALCLPCALPLPAQKQQREPLTEAQIDQIREAGIDPDARIKLYTKFTDEHAEVIKSLTNRARFTALMDELGSNLDLYSDRKADLRPSLKSLTEATPRWLGILRVLAGEPGFELARKEAIESGEELADQATRLLTEQTEYFKLHKDEKGQERAEPK
jgi:hypothetical protein